MTHNVLQTISDMRSKIKDHAENFYLNFSVANMVENERQRELPTMILFISKHFSDITKV